MPTSKGNPDTPSNQGTSEGNVPGNIADIDLQALAEEIVARLKKELRVENERRGRRPLW